MNDWLLIAFGVVLSLVVCSVASVVRRRVDLLIEKIREVHSELAMVRIALASKAEKGGKPFGCYCLPRGFEVFEDEKR